MKNHLKMPAIHYSQKPNHVSREGSRLQAALIGKGLGEAKERKIKNCTTVCVAITLCIVLAIMVVIVS